MSRRWRLCHFWCPKKEQIIPYGRWFFSFKLNTDSLFKCEVYEWEHNPENHHLSQNTSRRVWQASVHWSVELLCASSPVLLAGLSCQVDRVAKGWRDNRGWQTERSKAGPPQSSLHGFRTNKNSGFLLWMNMSRCDSLSCSPKPESHVETRNHTVLHNNIRPNNNN